MSSMTMRQRHLARKCLLIVAAQLVVLAVYFSTELQSSIKNKNDESVILQLSSFSHPKQKRQDTHRLLQQILQAKAFLIDLRIPNHAFDSSSSVPDNNHYYSGVMGIFCELDWALQKTNPSTVPMYKDLISQSKQCNFQTRFEMDLGTVVQAARRHDETSNHTTGASFIHSLHLTAAVFHETRCGSTLVANLLAAAATEHHRVYSEAAPPLAVLQRACKNDSCDDSIHPGAVALLRDVIYLMGRSNTIKETRVFFKIQSIGVHAIRAWSTAFPNTPWLFVYRNATEIIMSHLGKSLMDEEENGTKAKKRKRRRQQEQAVCLRYKRRPSSLTRHIIESQGQTVESLTNPEHCAAHLASLCEAALREYQRNKKNISMGHFINYRSLPDILWEHVLPDVFHVHDVNIQRMQHISQLYSKGRGQRANRPWHPDGAEKQSRASLAIRAAADAFLADRTAQLEQAGTEQQQQQVVRRLPPTTVDGSL